MKLTIGQKLYYVPYRWSYHSDPNEGTVVAVKKIGRRWATLDNNHRIDIETMQADGNGYSSPGMCYLSKVAYEKEIEADSAWKELNGHLTISRPKHLNAEQIRVMIKIINGEQ